MADPTWLLSVDPGLRACGCALWLGGDLIAAELVSAGRSRGEGLADDVGYMVELVKEWFHSRVAGGFAVVVELPRLYGGRARGDADGNDLIAVAAVAGGLVAGFYGRGRLVELVLPGDWKGSARKSVTEVRLREDLRPEEVSRVRLPARSLQHNVWDAVGIGMWWARRAGLRK